jgi:hypothetical protein
MRGMRNQPGLLLWGVLGCFLLAACPQPGGSVPGKTEPDPDEKPAAKGNGVLRLSVTVPDGLALATGSRVRMEKDGEPLSSLKTSGFSGGERPLTETIRDLELSLAPGSYVVDILLTQEGTAKTAKYHEIQDIRTDETTEISFTPPAAEFFTEEERAAITAPVSFKTTAANSTGVKIGSAGGSEVNRTRGISSHHGYSTVYFVVGKKSSQTLSFSGSAGSRVTPADSLVDGETPGPAKAVLVVDASALAETGGQMSFTMTVEESGKTPMTYTITLSIPSLVDIVVQFQDINEGEPMEYKRTYLVGESFMRESVYLTGTYSDKTKREVTDYEVEGFTSSSPGVITVRFKKSGVYGGHDTSTGKVTVYPMTVLAESPARLFFPYGYRIVEGGPDRSRYTVSLGKPLVIAPVCWRIPADATYTWTVSGGTYTTSGEFLTLTGTAVGTYAVTVTAYTGATPIAAANTTVECVNTGSSPSEDREYGRSHFAPGQFVEPNWGTSLGGYGGSTITALSADNTTGPDFFIQGNAFGGWVEPGIIWVMKDENQNNKADDTWYELEGNAAQIGIGVTRRYAVTYYKSGGWEDNLGNYGALGPGQTYPASWPDKITLVGTLLDRSVPGAQRADLLEGYVDTHTSTFDISRAIQVDGSPVTLDRIDFVRVQTGENRYTSMGEISTEYTEISKLWAEGRSLNGVSTGSGYTYQFINNSGYALTLSFKDVSGTTELAIGETKTNTRPESKVYFNFIGGNVGYSVSGNTVTFTSR